MFRVTASGDSGIPTGKATAGDLDRFFGVAQSGGDGGGVGGAAAGRTQFPSEAAYDAALTAAKYAEIPLMEAQARAQDAQAKADLAKIPLDYADALIAKWEAQVAAGNLSWKQAIDAFNADFDKATADANLQVKRIELMQMQAEALDTAQRARATERTDRARIVAQDILPASAPGLQGIQLPGMGFLPATQLDLPKLFGPEAPLPVMPSMGQFPQPQFPTTPTPLPVPAQPNLDPYLNPGILPQIA